MFRPAVSGFCPSEPARLEKTLTNILIAFATCAGRGICSIKSTVIKLENVVYRGYSRSPTSPKTINFIHGGHD